MIEQERITKSFIQRLSKHVTKLKKQFKRRKDSLGLSKVWPMLKNYSYQVFETKEAGEEAGEKKPSDCPNIKPKK